MKIVRANFGRGVYPTAYLEGLAIPHDKTWWLENGELREAKQPLGTQISRENLKLERADFGATERLAWATGACAIPQDTELAYWKQRYIATTTESALIIIDMQRSMVATIAVDGFTEEHVLVQGESLWLHDRSIFAIALAELEALFERASGQLDITIVESYPMRRQKRVMKSHIKYVWDERMAISRDDNNWDYFWLPTMPGAFEGAGVTLYDELHDSMFREIEIAGQRHVLCDPMAERVLHATLTVEPAVDPAGGPLSTGIVPSRQPDLDRLFSARADDLDDFEILIDLLEDSGEPYAPLLHALVAGDTSQQREALGLFASYLEDVQYHRGLPWSATLAADAPLDPEIGDLAAADQRLGLFHTLHIGDGPFAVYAKLVGSPRAVGLRHVDVPNATVMAALLAAKHTQLARLSNVKFATRAVIDGIADSVFDRVTHLHTVVELRTLAKQLAFLERDPAGFFKRAPRHLILTEAYDTPLLAHLEPVWRKLPVESLTVDGKLLTR